MVKKHLAGKSTYDFAIIATGSQDITQMDTINSPPTTLYENTSSQAKSIFETAQFMTTDIGIDVFICENPPRYDADKDDPTSMKQNLSKFSNGVIATSTLPAPRIVLIDQSSLARHSVRARSEIYQKDGISLTPKGLTYYTNNIMGVLQEYYGDMRQHEAHLDSESGRGRQGGDPDSRSGRARQGGDRQHGYDGPRRSYGSGGGRDSYRQRNYNNNRHRGAYDRRSADFPPDQQWHDRGSDHWDRGGQQRGGDHHWDYHGAGGYGGGYNRRRNNRR